MFKLSNAQVWVHDQDEALAFYTKKLGMEVRSDVTMPEMGDFRWHARNDTGHLDRARPRDRRLGHSEHTDHTRQRVHHRSFIDDPADDLSHAGDRVSDAAEQHQQQPSEGDAANIEWVSDTRFSVTMQVLVTLRRELRIRPELSAPRPRHDLSLVAHWLVVGVAGQ